MTWDAYHRRRDTLRSMLAIADRQRELTIPDLLDAVDGAHDVFPTPTDVLFELQMTWFQRLSGQIDRLLSEEPASPELVPVTAWVSTAAALPGARALLDAHRDDPALARAFGKELACLAMAGGGPMSSADLVTRGRRIQDSARDEIAASPAAPEPESRPGLIMRLRNAIAA